jgi:CBS domain-containing protein
MNRDAGATKGLSDGPHEALRVRRVEEIMTSRVYTVTASWSLLATARLLRRHHISGVPVVDAKEAPIGVISESDIARSIHEAAGLGSVRGLLDLVLAAAHLSHPELLAETITHLRRTRVSAVMSPRIVSVDPDTSLQEAARLLHRYQINRLPVVREHRIVGIVTRQDIVEALQHAPDPDNPVAHSRRFTRGLTLLEAI